MKFSFLFLIPALVAALLCSCSDDKGDNGQSNGTFNPVYEGHRSFWTLTTSNGLGVATYTLQEGGTSVNKLDRFKDHIYSNVDESTASKDYLYDFYFGYRKNGISSADTWLNQVDPGLAEYVNGTGIIHTVQSAGDLRFDSHYFVPFHAPGGGENSDRLLVALVQVSNTGTEASDCSLFSLINMHMGGEGDNASETVAYNSGAGYMAESKGSAICVYRNLVSSDSAYSADVSGGINNPWMLVQSGSHYNNQGGSQTGNDIAVGFENRINSGGSFAAGSSVWFGVVIGFSDSSDEATLWNSVNSFIDSRTPQQLLEGETAWWNSWHSGETLPAGLSTVESALYKQSTAVLKMGQVRESGQGSGQILASLVPGMWNISWVRDASYAIMGLTAAGHYSEAKQGLEFMLKATMKMDGADNYYQKNYIEPDLGVTLSTNYAISVTRYFGNGTEESDSNTAGPNIEWDNWGLFLWALGNYTETSGDSSLVTGYWEKISCQIADLLIELIDPARSILREDSSIWERHWAVYGVGDEPETRKHFAYSSICAYQGLKMAASMAGLAGDSTRQTNYTTQAERLKNGVLTNFVITPTAIGQPVLAGNSEEMGTTVQYMDLAVVEAFNTGLADPRGSLASGTLAAFDQYLRVGSHSPGFFRNDDGTWYDQQEWVVIDLRVAAALVRMGETTRAKQLLDWVTDQARTNYNLIGELLTADKGDYDGAIPMCGFGPGAWILAVHDYYGN